jgi:hypothetical protein
MTYQNIVASGVTVGGVQLTIALLVPTAVTATLEGGAGLLLPGWNSLK